MSPQTRRTIAQHAAAITVILLFLILMGLVGAAETAGM